MAFDLQIDAEHQAFLDDLPLSPYAKRRLDEFIDLAIADVRDDFREDPANRPNQDDALFQRDFYIVDAWGDDRCHRMKFTLDDSHAAVGVLVLTCIQYQVTDWRW